MSGSRRRQLLEGTERALGDRQARGYQQDFRIAVGVYVFRITAGSAVDGYDVDLVGADNLTTGISFEKCRTIPAGETLEVGDDFAGIVQFAGERPVLIVGGTGAGASGAAGVGVTNRFFSS